MKSIWLWDEDENHKTTGWGEEERLKNLRGGISYSIPHKTSEVQRYEGHEVQEFTRDR